MLDRTAIYVGQRMKTRLNLAQVVPSPDRIIAATVAVDPSTGGFAAAVDDFDDQSATLVLDGVTVGRYDVTLQIDTYDARVYEVCLPMVVLDAPQVGAVELSLSPGEKEIFRFDYALRMKPGESLQGVSAQVPSGMTASFVLDAQSTQRIVGTIAADAGAVAGVYDIAVNVTTNLSLPFNDTLRFFVGECRG